MRTKKSAIAPSAARCKEIGPKPEPAYEEKACRLVEAVFFAALAGKDPEWAMVVIGDYLRDEAENEPPALDAESLLLEGMSAEEVFVLMRKVYKRKVGRW